MRGRVVQEAPLRLLLGDAICSWSSVKDPIVMNGGEVGPGAGRLGVGSAEVVGSESSMRRVSTWRRDGLWSAV